LRKQHGRSSGNTSMAARKARLNVMRGHRGFSLLEATTALVILGLFTSSLLVVVDRCVTSVSDCGKRAQAFEVARENMEKLLAADSVHEMTEYGQSERYPDISWQTVVETFYEPITSRMWIRAVCSAQYTDSAGQTQTVALTHWLTDLTKEQLLALAKQQQQEKQRLGRQPIETIEEAAAYAGVDVETIQKWVENGMVVGEDGSFAKENLDLYKQTGGNPTPEQKAAQVQPDAITSAQAPEQAGPDAAQPADDSWKDQVDPVTGLTYGQLEEMDFFEIFELIKSRRMKNK